MTGGITGGIVGWAGVTTGGSVAVILGTGFYGGAVATVASKELTCGKMPSAGEVIQGGLWGALGAGVGADSGSGASGGAAFFRGLSVDTASNFVVGPC